MATTLSDWANYFRILGMLSLFALAIYVISGQPGSTNQKLCDWLQQTNASGYNQLMKSDAQFRSTCCAYDPKNVACN